jgi:anthranilate phosphoribosyltransferase
VIRVLDGSLRGAARAAVVLNAAAALWLAEQVGTYEEGVADAERALLDGAGIHALDRLRAATTASSHA